MINTPDHEQMRNKFIKMIKLVSDMMINLMMVKINYDDKPHMMVKINYDDKARED
jgi:hypothetical protein